SILKVESLSWFGSVDTTPTIQPKVKKNNTMVLSNGTLNLVSLIALTTVVPRAAQKAINTIIPKTLNIKLSIFHYSLDFFVFTSVYIRPNVNKCHLFCFKNRKNTFSYLPPTFYSDLTNSIHF